jgi:hypothetical protein
VPGVVHGIPSGVPGGANVHLSGVPGGVPCILHGMPCAAFDSLLEYNRKQQVDINGNLSKEEIINISVLQGSILGPILFLCYINDLPNSSTLATL